jgi:Ca-activated chloride channel family protein
MRFSVICSVLLLSVVSLYAGAVLLYNSGRTTYYAEQSAEYVNVSIIDQVATTEVEARFRRASPTPTDYQFVFRLPSSASVVSASVFEDTSWVSCSLVVVSDSSDTGIGTGTPSGFDYGLHPFVLELPMRSDTIIAVRFSYIELLSYDSGIIRYSYPWNNLASRVIENFTMDLYLATYRDMLTIESNDPSASIEYSTHSAVVTSELTSIRPTLDWNLSYTVTSGDISLTSMFFREEGADTGFFLFILEPPADFDSTDLIPKEFVFVVDKSGSMNGVKMTNAKAAAVSTIEILNPIDYLNVIGYSSAVDLFSPSALEATSDNKEAAIANINRMSAAGLTNIYGALEQALSSFTGELLSQVIFLTDGQPTSGTYQNPSAIVTNISDLNRRTADASIFTLGLGTDVDSKFLKILSFVNSGEYLYCTAANIGEVVENLMSYINYPVLGEPRVSVPDFPVIDVYPIDPPALYAGKQLIISGKYTGSGSSRVILSGEASSGHVEFDMGTVDFLTKRGNIHLLHLYGLSNT